MTIQTRSNTAQHRLQTTLLVLDDFKSQADGLALGNRMLRASLLDFGSHTPDNENCIKQIEYANLETRNRWGLKLTDNSIPLSELWGKVLTSDSLPHLLSQMQEQLPDLQLADVQATIEFSILLLKDIEKPFGLRQKLQRVFLMGKFTRQQEQIVNTNAALQKLLRRQKATFSDSRLAFETVENTMPATGEQVISWGIALKDYVLLSIVLNEIESCLVPQEMLHTFQNSPKQWDAATRLNTLLLLAFEGTMKVSEFD